MSKPEAPKVSPFKHKTPDESAGFLLWKITSLWQAKLALVLSEFKLTQTQYAILASLLWFEQHEEPTTQTHLGEHAKIEKMTLSKAVRNLEELGLVSRVKAPSDSRAFHVCFTKEGRKVIFGAILAVEQVDDEFFSVLTENQLESYKALTKAIIQDKTL
ncbi:MAG: hypothetical protein A2600_13875 [Candidatus Lambdaproteobacteria bacterium RIFOXYD1_FULL_56_27]|uniref:HTH marR-type domain-containing protein n=1 Tax=Candidatus Lambdaproteobacteria bacterium RIFOXYD2_FULL_56_26 TaxID=1817773 RepID=A0A1F6GS44_9PROT|nr:MAG: hypothetical protein A2426_11110 [Candidatus Lambdaproteobacteria bacterium RIFOXYC1_FULL_56_13]OGH00878.1 MAG: hypothetical protein A2557_01965 [Candidatus Lambdaproteobacteria bacterium RIFOXYD2_FULL_56_26]OGH08705.1 MAG: hypothetical protein A2600_13875 [Candidatus Lambdaproteobacteria bacterium RIFOXYD1_FULL_56_27]